MSRHWTLANRARRAAAAPPAEPAHVLSVETWRNAYLVGYPHGRHAFRVICSVCGPVPDPYLAHDSPFRPFPHWQPVKPAIPIVCPLQFAPKPEEPADPFAIVDRANGR